MANDIASRIQQRLDALGLSAREASISATGSDGTIRMILSGRTANPRTDTLEKLAPVLQTTATWLLSGDEAGGPPPVADALPPRRSGRSEVRRADVLLPSLGDLPRDLPVLGTVAGAPLGKGAFQLTSDVIDYVRRPYGLVGAKDAYALFVEGESMSPRFEPGDLVFVHPHRKVLVGDYIVIQEPDTDNGGPRGFIKRLKSMAPGSIKAEQFNPPGMITFLRPGTIVHKVMTDNELYGV